MKKLLNTNFVYFICTPNERVSGETLQQYELQLAFEMKEFFKKSRVDITMSGMDKLANETEMAIFAEKEVLFRAGIPMLTMNLVSPPMLVGENFPDFAESVKGISLITRAKKAIEGCNQIFENQVTKNENPITAIVAHHLVIQSLLWCMQDEGHHDIVRFYEPGDIIRVDFDQDIIHLECIKMLSAI